MEGEEGCAGSPPGRKADRRSARPNLEAQCLRACGPLDGSGLWYQPVAHDGNRNRSEEEAEAVARIVARLLADGCWVDADGAEAPLGPDDILVVAPYNAQVALLRQRLPLDSVGTVDKFQGQQAPVVIYSMASSTPEDAPRGMEFLYSRNRLDVATSRARCAVILVANPRLLEPACRTPRQMRLANALCAFVERARALQIG